MKDDELQGIIDSLSGKLGEENQALIVDDIGKLITINSGVVKELEMKDAEISKLKANNEKLITANGNLLQSLPLGKEREKEKEDDTPKVFDYRSLFNKDGTMKK